MGVPIENSILSAVKKIFTPLVRILLRNGISYGTFADIAKRAYVDVAGKEFGIEGKKQTVSRISLLTGLTRKEVNRVRSLPLSTDSAPSDRYNRASRVISGWLIDPRFSDGRGNPHPLQIETGENSFRELVRAYSGDVPARAVLDELSRVNAVELKGKTMVNLIVRAYIPNKDDAVKLHILGTDVSDLISTIDHNLSRDCEPPRFQRKVCYDNLPRETIPQLRDMTERESQRLLERFDRWMSARDRDVNPRASGTGRTKAGVGIYYFEADVTEEDKQNENK
jgi:hypothetical protein